MTIVVEENADNIVSSEFKRKSLIRQNLRMKKYEEVNLQMISEEPFLPGFTPVIKKNPIWNILLGPRIFPGVHEQIHCRPVYFVVV
ncbi:hypothetical protein SADUNF_Sadunf06G0155300 [Salix dunnii]|uniref:Uncharacterized protein n=1 Tax=Salix dunnii TaxID=1413687 RepID=A0A835JZC4_9ROSI|nr:hypothetical protein SADUNF_Sadunf06G0155300 [Salix dunnii]